MNAHSKTIDHFTQSDNLLTFVNLTIVILYGRFSPICLWVVVVVVASFQCFIFAASNAKLAHFFLVSFSLRRHTHTHKSNWRKNKTEDTTKRTVSPFNLNFVKYIWLKWINKSTKKCTHTFKFRAQTHKHNEKWQNVTETERGRERWRQTETKNNPSDLN